MKTPIKKTDPVALSLWRDPHVSPSSDSFVIELADALRTEFERDEYRKAFDAVPDGQMRYAQLRWVLMVVAKSQASANCQVVPLPPVSRRLTWYERLTGRVFA